MTKIAHLADIHIQDRRRAEYAAVFARLYASLRQEAPDIIVVAGDIFDNKMRASAHNLEDVGQFLTALSDIAPVIVIAGNHDTNCLTPGALDLLSPLLAEHRHLQPPRLTFWRNSGQYEAHGIDWTVIATDGAIPAANTAAAVTPKLKICLFHEEVNGALLPNGSQLRDYKLSARDFAPFDAVLGGHIHLRQQITPRAAYCGSLIQQNIGEDHHGHGYLLWELDAAAATILPKIRGIDIPNSEGYLRVRIGADGTDLTAQPVPDAPLYWEVLLESGGGASGVSASTIAAYTDRYQSPPRAIRHYSLHMSTLMSATLSFDSVADIKEDSKADSKADICAAQDAAASLEAHEEIIREITDPALADAVITLHRERYSNCQKIALQRATGGRIRLLRLEFDNMYAFGPGNIIDFTQLEGYVSGVIAPNHVGKSSLIEALLFALYEEHPRAATKGEIIHAGASSCRIALDFELDGKTGRIEKGFIRGKVQTSRYRLTYAGEDRTGGGTPDTLREIRALIGDAATALASSFQLQGAETTGFIAARPPDRKKLLADVLSLGSFIDIERDMVKELTALNGEVRALAGQYRGVSAEALTKNLADLRETAAAAELQVAAALAAVATATAAHTAAAEAYGACAGAAQMLTDSRVSSASEALAAAEAWAAAAGSKQPIHAQANKLIRPDTVFPPVKPTVKPAVKPAAIDEPIGGDFIGIDFTTESTSQIVERGGARPTRAEVERVLPWAARAESDRRSAMLAAAGWDPDAHAQLVAALAAPEAAPEAAATAEALAAAEANVAAADAYAAAQKHVESLRRRHVPAPGCSACATTTQMFDAGEHSRAVAAAATAAVALQKVRADYNRVQLIQKQKIRLCELEAAAAAATKVKKSTMVISILERGKYWQSRDAEAAMAAAIKQAQDVAAAEAAATAAAEAAAEAAAAAAAYWHEIARNWQSGEGQAREQAREQARGQVATAAAAVVAAGQARDCAAADVTAANTKAAVIAAQLEVETSRAVAAALAATRAATVKAYRAVLNATGGIGDRLLERARPQVEAAINAAARELGAQFTVSITPEFDMLQCAGAGAIAPAAPSLPVALGSGYQKFILGLATRLAIWRLAAAPRPDAFIVDEGFGACDDEYLDSLAGALEALAAAPGGPRLIFVVSHVDTLKARLERALTIETGPAGSRVVAATGMSAPSAGLQACLQASQAAPASSADTTLIPALGLDPAKLWCASCAQAITVACGPRHLASARHINSVKKQSKKT